MLKLLAVSVALVGTLPGGADAADKCKGCKKMIDEFKAVRSSAALQRLPSSWQPTELHGRCTSKVELSRDTELVAVLAFFFFAAVAADV